LNILAVGAHPDDLELLCSGTLALFSKKGHKVFMCHACDGNKGSFELTSEEIAKIRRSEAIKSASLIGAESLYAGFSDGELVIDMESKKKMTDIIRQANPDIVITHYPDDYHPDHRTTSALVFEAHYMSRFNLFKTNYKNTNKIPVLYYMDTLACVNFNPVEYVDISETIEIKINMMIKMESQLGFLQEVHGTNAEDFIRTIAKFRGFQVGVPYAEAFVLQQKYPFGLTKRILP
jgi:N-acetylglucosamine malate deacetylase 1